MGYFSHCKLSNTMVTDACAAKTQFADGLSINTDHKSYFLSQQIFIQTHFPQEYFISYCLESKTDTLKKKTIANFGGQKQILFTQK